MSRNMHNGVLTVGLVQIFCQGETAENASFLERAVRHCFGLPELPADKIMHFDAANLDGDLFELPEDLRNVLPCLDEDASSLLNAKLCTETGIAYAIYALIPQTEHSVVTSLEATFTLMLPDGCFHEAGSYWEDMPGKTLRPELSDTLETLSGVTSQLIADHGPGDTYTPRLQAA